MAWTIGRGKVVCLARVRERVREAVVNDQHSSVRTFQNSTRKK